MRQYCSGGSSTWSSIQPRAGRLQQWVVEEEQEAAARLQDAGHLGDGAVHVDDVLEHEARDDRVEGLVGAAAARSPRPAA